MEFNEKLQELRKQKGLTQEELAEILFVSRTAVSKWESGRGMPSIESLKAISKFFTVTLDDLLSSEELLVIAEDDHKKKEMHIRDMIYGLLDCSIRGICDLLFGMIDVSVFLLMVLPLYPKKVGEYISSVNLFVYTEIPSFIHLVYWILFIALILLGITQLTFTKLEKGIISKVVMEISVGIHIFMVLFLASTKEVYAVIVAFLLLVVKGMVLLKCQKAGG